MKPILSLIFVLFVASKYMRMLPSIILSLFWTRKGYTKKETHGVSFKLFSESLNMKIFLSDIASFHTRQKVLKGIFRVIVYLFFGPQRLKL
jgi:hypothetical protein